MGILKSQLVNTGFADAPTNIIWLKTDSTLAEVLVAGYLSLNLSTSLNQLNVYQLAAVYTTDSGTVLLQVTFANKLWSLSTLPADSDTVTFSGTLTPGNLVSVDEAGGVIEDSGVAVTNVQLKSALKAGTTAAYAGGGTSNAFTATGLTATSKVVASITTSTNAVSIAKVVPGTNLLTITFSADPGAATTVTWIALPAAQ